MDNFQIALERLLGGTSYPRSILIDPETGIVTIQPSLSKRPQAFAIIATVLRSGCYRQIDPDKEGRIRFAPPIDKNGSS